MAASRTSTFRIHCRRVRLAATVLWLLWVTACVGLPDARPPHPLAERVFMAAGPREVDRETLLDRVARAEVVYLGEVHDNPDHHARQLRLLEDVVARGKRPSIGFEIFSADQTPYLMSFVTGNRAGAHAGDPETEEPVLRALTGWDRRPDEEWSFYAPLLRLAREHGISAFGIDLNRGLRNRITREGLGALTPVERDQVVETGFDDPDYRELMLQRLTDSHCGWSEPILLGKLYENWVARNDSMAHAITTALTDESSRPVLVVVGAGHTQNNMGVFERVESLRPGTRQVNLAFRVPGDPATPIDVYFEREKLGERSFPPGHEILWFTEPPVDAEDPCEQYRAVLKKAPA